MCSENKAALGTLRSPRRSPGSSVADGWRFCGKGASGRPRGRHARLERPLGHGHAGRRLAGDCVRAPALEVGEEIEGLVGWSIESLEEALRDVTAVRAPALPA